MKESRRDVVVGDLGLEYFAKWMSAGWTVASIEWVREADKREADQEEYKAEEMGLLSTPVAVPYGLRMAGGGAVEENPLEATVLLMILDQIVKEQRVQDIAAALNVLGYVTRAGHQWSASDVFNLLPRLIEVGPELMKSSAWQQKRAGMTSGSKTVN